jgi:hypothetical protein
MPVLTLTSHFFNRVAKENSGDGDADFTFITYVVLALVTIAFYCLLVFFIGTFLSAVN